MKNRIEWIDAAKGIGIFFVVWAHTTAILPQAKVFLYMFHMPLFFILSGFCYKHHRVTFLDFIKSQAKSIVVPYFFWGIMTYIVWVVILRNYGEDASFGVAPLKPLFGMFYGVGNDMWLQHNIPLWFLPCLFFTKIVFNLIMRLKKSKAQIVACCAFPVVGVLAKNILLFRLPWSLDVAFVAVTFFGFGYLLKTTNFIEKHLGLKTLVLCGSCSCCIYFFNGRVDMMTGLYNNIGLFLLGGISGSLTCVFFARLLWVRQAFSSAGKASLIIFLLHNLSFSFLTAIAVFVFKLPLSFKSELWGVDLVYTFLSIFFLVFLSKVIFKYFPFVVGKRRVV